MFLVSICSSLQADNAPSTYTAYTGTDIKTIPPAPALGPANSVIKDPTFGSRILRVTDANTNGGESFMPTDSGFHRTWNANSTAIKISGPHGDGYWMDFNPGSFTVGDGSSKPAIHQLPFTSTWEWSTVDPNILYFLHGAKIGRYDKSTGTSTDLAGTPNGDALGYFAVVIGQDNWVCAAAGNGNQDTYTKIFCVNPLSPSTSKFVDVYNKTINGTAQGDPNWPVSASGSVIGIHDISGGTGASWLEVTFHHASWGGNGGAVFNLATNTWSLITNADIYWSGHVSMGNGTYANSGGSRAGNDGRGMLLRNPDNLMNTGNYVFIEQPVGTLNDWCDGDHSSWLNSITNPKAPILLSLYTMGTCHYTWTGEIIAAATDGSNTVWRFAHNHNGGSNCYFNEAFAQISNDGKWALFSSYWDGTLGADTAYGCSTRIDTFIVDLTGGTTAGSGGSTPGTAAGGSTGSTTGGTTGGATGGGTTGTAPTSTVTRVEESSSSVVYTGSWSSSSNIVYSGGTAKGSMDTGSAATFTFNGTSVSVIVYCDQWSGIATISVDGVSQGNFDAYASPSKSQAQIFKISGLASGSHTIKVAPAGTRNPASSAYWIWLDAFDVASGSTTSSSGTASNPSSGTSPTTPSGTTTTATRIEESSSSVDYTGPWSSGSNIVYSGGTAKGSMDSTARATLTFNGTTATFIVYCDEYSGIATIFVDGVAKAEVDAYAAPANSQAKLYTVSGLSSGLHTVALAPTGRKNSSSGGAFVWLDAFDVTGTADVSTATTTPAPSGSPYSIEQDNAAVVFTGTWSLNGNAAMSGGSARLSMDPGSRATFTFTGTSVTWVGYRDEWSGVAKVYVDGVLRDTVDTYASPAQRQTAMYAVTDLAWGEHTIAVEAAGTHSAASMASWIWVDRFDYVGADLTTAADNL